MDRAQVRAARALLGWSQEDLSRASGVGMTTLKRIEPGQGELKASAEVIEKIRAAIESAGVEAVPGSDLKGQGVRWSRPSDRERYAFILQSLETATAALRAARAACQKGDPESDLERALAIVAKATEDFETSAAYEADIQEMIDSRASDGRIDGINEK